MTPKRIGVVGFERVTALHLIGVAEAFSAAALDDGYGGRIPCYEVCTIGAASDCFRTESGLTFAAAHDLERAPVCDTIVICGGEGLADPLLIERLMQWLLQTTGTTRRVGSIGAGLVPLAATGLLDRCEVSADWRMATALARKFPNLRIDHRKPVVRAGRYYTCNGLAGGLNLSLAMIEADYGPHVARSVAQELALFSTARPQEGHVANVPAEVNHTTDRFAELVSWIMRNLHADLSVEVLARRACMSQDHFSKAFKSLFGVPPRDFVENLRLNEAQRRLAKRQKTVQSVAASVGFVNTGAFQRAFERRFGKRPSRLLEESGVRQIAAKRRVTPAIVPIASAA